jgi:16S rRNA (guanine966-N2)-methyltransferase
MKQKNVPQKQLRIIGGKWRSRKISFLPLDEVRPTTDRTRETLFNWLQPYIENANCLDLFAGSGALSFEALSRGAKKVIAVDHSNKVIAKLKENAVILQATNLELYCFSIPENLDKIPNLDFDIIFLDPPFIKHLVKLCCEALEQLKFLKNRTLIYIEAESNLEIKENIPSSWEILKSSKTKQIGYYLIKKQMINTKLKK